MTSGMAVGRPMALSWQRLAAIARKEVLQLRRDPRSLAMAFLVPAILTLMFGYVMNFDVRNIKLGVLDQDRTSTSRELAGAFTSSGYFTVTHTLTRDADIEPLLQRGAVRMVLVIPPGFSSDLMGGRGATLQGLVDGGDANTAAIALNYAQAITTAWGARAVLRGVTITPPVTAQCASGTTRNSRASTWWCPG